MPVLSERLPPPDDGPKQETCLICGGIVLVYPSLGVMHHDNPALDAEHLARVIDEI